jgi:RNA polymerase-binding transcription factor DksA
MDAEANGPLKSWITNQSDGSRSRWRRATVAFPKPTENCCLRRLITATMKAIRANNALARELDLNQKSRDRALLTSMEAALTRIHEGTFGQCLNCEQEINPKRLEAIPWVRYCITCQELIDGTK